MVEFTETNLESVNIDVPKRVVKVDTSAKLSSPVEPETSNVAPQGPGNIDIGSLVPQTASLDQVSAKEYLQLNVFPKLESALNTVSKTLINQKMNEKSN